jgi:molybdopterin/thiamine biosynthesis adenylyltransferase
MSEYSEKFLRNPLTKSGQGKIRDAAFAIIGLGGTGGFMLENLLRMGAENIAVFDHDRFEPSNFNRQPLATDDSLDLQKTDAAIERAKSINRGARIRAHDLFEEGTGLDADIVLDGTDNVKSKLSISRAARKENIPYVFCSAQSSRGIVSVFTKYKFEKAFQIPKDEEALAGYPSCSGTI